LKQSEYVDDPSGVPVVMPKDIKDGRIDFDGAARITDQKAQTLSRHFLSDGDIIFPRRGDINKLAIVEGSETVFCGTGCLRIHTPSEGIVPKFLFYFLGQPKVAEWLEARAIGSTMLNLNTAIMRGVEVRFPDRPSQQRIASTLAAYDELIENNRRRIALLEDAARQLYKEWFVRFRFAGHEHIKIVDGLPAGWERQAIGEVADDISYGYTASADADIDGPKFLRITDIVKGQISWPDVPRCPIDARKAARFALETGDVVVARTGATTGWAKRIGRVREPAVFASYLVRFRFTDLINPAMAAVFMESESYKAMVWAGIGGAAQPNASAQLLAKPKLLVPPKALQEAFAQEVVAGQLLIDVLMEQIHGLSRARDLLLPRLMSGALTV
jgi:type I restriction enzyme S subunit